MTPTEREHHVTRQITIVMIVILAVSAITAIASVAASWVSVSRSLTNTVTIEQTVTNPKQYIVCAGDVFSVTYHVDVAAHPAIVAIYDTWYSNKLGYNVVLESEPQYSVILAPEDFTRTLVLTTPDLPAGDYQYLRANQEDGSPISIMSIPVTIKDCP